MYVLLAVMFVSRVLARSWVAHVHATRSFLEPTAEIGDDVRVSVRVKNTGFLPVPWILLEDLLPRPALTQRPPRLQVRGSRIVLKLLRPGADVIALVKPQFEAGRSEIRKGVIRDTAVQSRVVEEVSAAAREVGLNPAASTPSPITGAKGNVEFLLHLRP